MSNILYTLLERHQKLDSALHSARRSQWIDPFEIALLKKHKLAIKDKIARLARKPQLAV